MLSSTRPPFLSMTALLFRLSGFRNEALNFFNEMKKSELKPNCVIYNVLIDATCKAGRVEDAKEIFSRIFVGGLQPDIQNYTTLINGLCKKGLLNEAYQLLPEMEKIGRQPDGCTYIVLIQGHLRYDIFSADTTTTELVLPHVSKGDLVLTSK